MAVLCVVKLIFPIVIYLIWQEAVASLSQALIFWAGPREAESRRQNKSIMRRLITETCKTVKVLHDIWYIAWEKLGKKLENRKSENHCWSINTHKNHPKTSLEYKHLSDLKNKTLWTLKLCFLTGRVGQMNWVHFYSKVGQVLVYTK